MAYDDTSKGKSLALSITIVCLFILFLLVGTLCWLEMSNRETLRVQLDSARLELQALQVENRNLKEELQVQTNQSKELELTQELVAVWEENICLVREWDELTTRYEKGRTELQEMEQLQQQVDEQSKLV